MEELENRTGSVTDISETMAKKSTYFVGDKDLYMIWCGWNFTQNEWMWFSENKIPEINQEDDAAAVTSE